MENHQSALKRHRQSLKLKALNQANRHKLKAQMKKLRAAIETGKRAHRHKSAPCLRWGQRTITTAALTALDMPEFGERLFEAKPLQQFLPEL